MQCEIFRDDFVKYKKLKPLETLELRGGKKTKKFHIVDVSDGSITKEEIDDYSLGDELIDIKSTGYLLPTFPKWSKDKIGEHGERLIITLTGQSGSGKSTLAAHLAKQWKKANSDSADGQIILISPKPDCKELNKLKPYIINCVDHDKIHKNFIDDDTRVRYLNSDGSTEFSNSLVILDDIEGIVARNKKESVLAFNNIVADIINPIIVHGRHENCSLIYVKHNTDLNTPFSRLMNQESEWVGLFPRRGDHPRISAMMKNHLLLSPAYINRILKINPWYILHHKRFPGYTLCEHALVKP